MTSGRSAFEESAAGHKRLFLLATGNRTSRWFVRRFKALAYLPARRSLRASGQFVRSVNGVRMQLDPDSWQDLRIYRAEVRGSAYEPGTTRLLNSLLRPGEVFVDVGANNGYFSLLAASKVGPSGHVYAFEPVPSAYARLARNVGLNRFDAIDARCLAVGAARAHTGLYVMDRNDGAASLHPMGREFRRVEVDVDSLDGQLPDTVVDVVKIDVEGHEVEVLEGMAETIRRSPRLQLICEYNYPLMRDRGARARDDPLFAKLGQLGFQCREILDEGLSPGYVTSFSDLRRALTNLYCVRAS